MYAVTDDYKTGIYAISRSNQGRVTFDISPVGIESDAPSVAVSNEFAFSQAQNQISDNVRQSTYYLSTWESDLTKLNGAFTFAADAILDRGETGWIGNNISDSSGNLTNTSITLTFSTSYTSAGVTVTFDPLMGGYAKDFTVVCYDASNNPVHTSTVTNNTLVQWRVIATVANFKKITLTITKWSDANRRARVIEIDAGVVLVYDDNSLIRFNSTEEIDPVSGTMVIPEFSFTVDNSNSEFDILNPTGIYASLQERQKILAEIGLDLTNRTEWVPVGTYLLSEWKSDTGSLTATFTGRSKLDLLDSSNFEQSTAQTGYSIYDLVEDILTTAGITIYSIDAALQSISTNGLCEKKTCREALQLAAIAGQSVVYVARNDVLTVKKYSASYTSVDYVDFDDMKEEPQIETGKPVLSVTVNYYTVIGTVAGAYTYNNANVAKGSVITMDGNTFINTNTQAQNVANWIFNRQNDIRTFTVDFRGNPALELNDYIQIENRYVNNQYINLTKIDLSYEGYLTGQMKGRSV